MRQLKLNFTSHDPVVILEFILVMLATLCFVGGIFTYLAYLAIPIWSWLAFSFFILAKAWLEFFETCQDRRVHQIPESELPAGLRRQAD